MQRTIPFFIIYSRKFKVFNNWSIMSAYINYRVQMGVIKRNAKVAMETIGEAKARKAKLASSDEIVVDQLKLNAKNKNTTKSTQTWLNVWGKWANERKFNPKMEDENEDLDTVEPRLSGFLDYPDFFPGPNLVMNIC